ncbi:sensor histidine kinase [Amycolatopsis acidicola]|uniref:histidine kinase n=1 Tax=Amycolatopsis acidicola TaxID=2596893 RepID=A0A5N0V3B4_9PSEU|nr:histidine kinase [Amycolatopsis acidicola]KAA9158111.1 sensor histidine kinase [Amycolatopsis acidicola]
MPIPNLTAFARRHRAAGLVLLDVVVAGFVAYSVTMSVHGHWPLVLLTFAGLVVRRRWPLVAMAAALVVVVFGPNLGPAFVALYTVGAVLGPRLWTWSSVVASVAAFVTMGQINWGNDWKSVGLGLALFVALPVLAGLWMHQRANLLTALRERAEQAERERHLLAEQALAAERRRIAGEMHDIVAHRVSVIAVQAGAITVVAKDERVGEAAEVIRKNGTAALSELRDMLRVLRNGGEDESTPPPGLDGIPELVEDSRAAGTKVEVRLPDPVPELPVPVGRAVYRLAQEALTNVAKHAPGALVRVSVTDTPDELAVDVVNDAPPGQSGAGLPSSGYGLAGMRERVMLAGGTVSSGPTADGGFAVHARFPWEGAAA